MQNFRPGGFTLLPPLVKNLLIINGLLFLATVSLQTSNFRIDLYGFLSLHTFRSPDFSPYQFITYLFMHGGFTHLFFNMFALWMFGNVLEQVWGSKRFFVYYFVCGIGAAIIHLIVLEIQLQSLMRQMDPMAISQVMREGADILQQGKNYVDSQMGSLNILLNTRTVGASGAVFGILLAFGMLFPNSVIYLFFAFPLKAKYFVMLYGALELYLGISRPGSNIAHFAHLGGMVFGYLLIRYWKSKGRMY